MTNNDEWNAFLDNLLSITIKKHRESKEGESLRQRYTHIDEMLTTNLTIDEKHFVEEIIFELGLTTDREAEIVYHQGIKDCVWLLKRLGVLA